MAMARIAVLVAGGLLLAMPVRAQCDPPPGLSPLRWYAICGSTLREAYRRGSGQGLSFEAFSERMYRVYLRPPPMPRSSPAAGDCTAGHAPCFGDWPRHAGAEAQ
ncbi:MAG TPA: hypothetical protein VGM87_08330 [Roseomonas sp.]|jgi:hypothetical protein